MLPVGGSVDRLRAEFQRYTPGTGSDDAVDAMRYLARGLQQQRAERERIAMLMQVLRLLGVVVVFEIACAVFNAIAWARHSVGWPNAIVTWIVVCVVAAALARIVYLARRIATNRRLR